MLKIHGHEFTYDQFLLWVSELVKEGKTSGIKQTEALASFTTLNYKRMQRIGKTLKKQNEVQEKLRHVVPQNWLIITEAWCGDSAQTLPVLAGIADASHGKISLSIILRGENPDWIQKYHTHGSHSIPKLVGFNEDGEELFSWGPRPNMAQKLLMAWNNNPDGRSWDDFEKELHTWYAKDKTLSIQKEILESLNELSSVKSKIESALV